MNGNYWTPMRTPLPQRIKCMSGFDPETNCWPWLAATDALGYGHLATGGTQRHAHRMSYEAFVGPIPEDMTVDHLCFNRVCVNPDHLRLLTNVENAGNQRTYIFVPHEQVREAIARYRAGETQASIAASLGVSGSAVSRWVLGKGRVAA